ncbi:MAG: hypothetical protein ACRC7G_14845 [Beijerinckiaceae bacterium]
MNVFRLFLDDEGEITRRQWWIGVATLVFVQIVAQLTVVWQFAALGLDRGLLVFLGIAMVLPFHALNAKRFRAIGRPPLLALPGAVVGICLGLASTFAPQFIFAAALGFAAVLIWVWYVVDLGFVDHDAPKISAAPAPASLDRIPEIAPALLPDRLAERIAAIAQGRRTA